MRSVPQISRKTSFDAFNRRQAIAEKKSGSRSSLIPWLVEEAMAVTVTRAVSGSTVLGDVLGLVNRTALDGPTEKALEIVSAYDKIMMMATKETRYRAGWRAL